MTGHELVSVEDGTVKRALIRNRGAGMSSIAEVQPQTREGTPHGAGTRRAMFIVFSGDMDRAMAAFTMATAAAASGFRTTMFFTFWGLSVLRDKRSARKKSPIEWLFGAMLPSGPSKLPTSKMNFRRTRPKALPLAHGEKEVRGPLHANRASARARYSPRRL